MDIHHPVDGATMRDVADADRATTNSPREVHLAADACASCHSAARSAFVSYPTARALAPVIGPLDDELHDLIVFEERCPFFGGCCVK